MQAQALVPDLGLGQELPQEKRQVLVQAIRSEPLQEGELEFEQEKHQVLVQAIRSELVKE